MAGLKLESFGPMVPRVSKRLLKPGQAQEAEYCKLRSGLLGAYFQRRQIYELTKPGELTSLYLFGEYTGSYWLHWVEDVDVQRAPVANDTTERTYFTGLDAPRSTDSTLIPASGIDYPTSSYLLGVPAPLTAPTTTLGAGGTGTANARAYVTTLVTGWGEEGPPSPASTVLPTVLPGQIVTVDGFETPPTGDYNFTLRRIYRSASGATTTGLQLLVELPIATTTYEDTTLDEDLGAILESDEWDPPPSDLHSLITLPNNVMAGISNNEVCFSEPGYPHAWPVRYRKTTSTTGVGLASFGNTVVVGTQGQPYLIVANTPATASIAPIPAQQACMSKRSVVRTNRGVAYASPDGLIHISGSGVENLTKDVFTREEWQAYAPDSMHIYHHDGRFFVFYRTGYDDATGRTEGAGFIFDPEQGGITTLPFYAHAGYVDLHHDALYLMIRDADTGVYNVEEWEGAVTRETYTWRSGEMAHPRPTNMAVGMVVWADLTDDEIAEALALYNAAVAHNAEILTFDGPFSGTIGSDAIGIVDIGGEVGPVDVPAIVPDASVILYLYGDGVLRATKTVSDNEPFTLPGGYNATVWSVKLRGNRDVAAVHMATTMTEVKGL